MSCLFENVFVFVNSLVYSSQVPHKARLTRTSMKAAEERVVSVVVPGVTRTTPSTAVKSIPVNIAIYNSVVLFCVAA